MKDIRFDAEGRARCWNIGAQGLTEKRTFRSKALVGVGSLLTKKKLKCQRCGEYNDSGIGKPYDGPASRKYRKEWDAEQVKIAAAPPASADSVAADLAQLGQMHADGLLTVEEFVAGRRPDYLRNLAPW